MEISPTNQLNPERFEYEEMNNISYNLTSPKVQDNKLFDFNDNQSKTNLI